MPQVVAWVGTAVASAAYAATASAAVAAWTYGATTFLLTTVAPAAILSGLAKAMAPKLPVAQRQADILELSLGEHPREAILGRAVTGGSLMDAFNYGTDNEWEVMVIALADHECVALEGFYVNETYYSFSADGLQSGFSNSLEIYWRPGTLSQTPPSSLVSASGGRWTSDDRALGVAHVWVAYKINDQVWQAGRPRFRWRVQGAKLYDPRKDSTVAGGSGAHRYNDPTTWEWSENAAICRYNWVRGIYTNGQLMVGPGRSADEAPPEDVIGDANICDEDVTLKAGGTEKRYRVGCVIRADEQWSEVEEDFALAMGGDLIERAGSLAVDVGAANSVVATFTDDDLIVGQRVAVQAKLSRADLVNTVTASFVDPGQLWQDNTAPLRRDASAITADGEVRERDLPLRFVTSQTQAQRLSSIALKRARLQRSATVTLGPKFCLLEVGDWVEWTSARYHDGATRTYQIVGCQIDGAGLTTLALREIASSVYAWTPASDELDPASATPAIPSAPGAASISGFSASATTVSGGGVTIPAIAVTWTAVTDPTIKRVRMEYQRVAGGSILTEWSDAPASGSHVLTSGLTAENWRVRVTPEPEPARDATTTSWTTVTVGALAAGTAGVASSITGQGWGATASEAQASNALVPVGANAVLNSELLAPHAPWGPNGRGWDGNSGLSVSRAWISGQRVAAYATIVGTPASGRVFDILSTSPGDTGYAAERTGIPVLPGERIYMSMSFAAQGCANCVVLVAWLSDAGVYSYSDVVAAAPSVDGSAVDPATYTQVGGFFTAPAGARWAFIIGRGITNGSANPKLWAMMPFIARVPTGQTAAPPYTPGPPDRLADLTSANTAAAILGQGPWATYAGSTERVAYLNDSGRLTNGRLGLPINLALGYGATFNPVYPLSSSSSSSISVAATTITWPGDSLSIGSATISGLSADTLYNVFWDTESSAFVAVSSGATAYITNPSRYIAFGTQRTQLSGGGFTPPDDPPVGGGGGGGGGGGDYIP